MFSGIIQAHASILSAKDHDRVKRVRIEKPSGWKPRLGASINVDGICSTVVAMSAKAFDVEYMPETLSKTTAGKFAKGTRVNLERSLKLSDTLDGHFVSGHVDACARVAAVEPRGASIDISITIPRHLLKFVAPQGSISINGVSLTVARMKKSTITFALIPHTLGATNLSALKRGSEVNIEVDLLARYAVASRAAGARVVGNAKE
jgi:riboflavin synthase